MADTRVAEATKNFQVNQASYQADVASKKAASDMMYDIVKAQTTQKLIEEQQKIKIVEAQKEVELQQVEVQKRQVQLETEVTKPAEAEQTRIRLMAQAEQEKRKMLADADAQAMRLQAQGDADARRLRAIAEAEATKAIGLAQAEASRAQGLAEATIVAARGQAEAEAMTKKAEAFKQYNDAAMASMIVEKLPSLVEAAAAPLSKIGNLTVLSSGGDGVSKVTSDVLNVAAQSLTMVKGLTGIDIAQALKRGEGTRFMDETNARPAARPDDAKPRGGIGNCRSRFATGGNTTSIPGHVGARTSPFEDWQHSIFQLQRRFVTLKSGRLFWGCWSI
jgi:flotillin